MDEIRGRDLGETDYHQQCYEYDTCMIYENLCDGEPEDDFSEYFECTQVESNNGQIAYVGPHCGGDGYTVQLGVYSDEYCNEYIGDGVNIAKFVEDAEEDSLLEYVSGTVKEINEQSLYSPYPEMIMLPEYGFCIPCREAVSICSCLPSTRDHIIVSQIFCYVYFHNRIKHTKGNVNTATMTMTTLLTPMKSMSMNCAQTSIWSLPVATNITVVGPTSTSRTMIFPPSRTCRATSLIQWLLATTTRWALFN